MRIPDLCPTFNPDTGDTPRAHCQACGREGLWTIDPPRRPRFRGAWCNRCSGVFCSVECIDGHECQGPGDGD